jgi:hypothetical protein
MNEQISPTLSPRPGDWLGLLWELDQSRAGVGGSAAGPVALGSEDAGEQEGALPNAVSMWCLPVVETYNMSAETAAGRQDGAGRAGWPHRGTWAHLGDYDGCEKSQLLEVQAQPKAS